MRKSTLALVAIATAFTASTLVGCKKVDDDNNVSIVGEWEVRKENYKIYSTATNPPTLFLSQDTTYASGQGTYINFKADNTYITKDNATSSASESGTYTYDNGRIISKTPGSTQSDTINIVLNANDFVISGSETDNTAKTRIDYAQTYNRR